MEPEYSTMSSESSLPSSDLSQESTRLEECRIEGVDLKLPQGLCENKDIFREFFSLQTWQESLTEQQKHHLKNFLPTFPENDMKEKEHTLKILFNRENMRFGAPLTDFHVLLKNGHYRPDISKMRALMRKAQFREYKHQQRRYYYRLMKEILLSRQRLLETAFNQPPGSVPKMERIPHPTPHVPQVEQRARRRYFEELAAIRQEVQEEDHSSEDDNFPEGPPPRLSKKQKRQLAMLESSLSPNLKQVTSTVAMKPSGFDLESNVTSNHNPYEMNEDLYKNMLLRHKKRRMEGDNHPDLNTLGITMQDVEIRSQLGKKIPISRNNLHPSNDSFKSLSKKKIKVETPNSKSAPPSIRRISMNSPLPVGGDSSNASDVGDSEDEDGADHDVERYESEVLEHSSVPRVRTTPTMLTPKARTKRTSSVSSSPRSTKANRNSIQQRKVKLEPEEEQIEPYSNVASSTGYTLSTSNQYQQHLSNSHQHPTPTTTSAAAAAAVAAAAIATTPTTTSFGGRHLNAATLSDLDGIDMMNLPVDLDETPHDPMDITLDDINKPTPELMQETHACYFSLIRDVIYSTPEHRMSLASLEDRLKAWQENPISPLNDWYCLAPDSWGMLLTSAVSFLCGDYPDAQPEDFVPYLEYKPQIQAYQWIGAGRDSDSHLVPLCQYWLDHRDEMRSRPIKEEGDAEDETVDGTGSDERACSPPPPRCPTTWAVRPTLPEEKEIFQEQERQRYENPHRAFTFRMHGYESVVGPVKGVYNQSVGVNKPRGHSLLVADRPNFVTILALVRDATARLPNGEGTRSDICELLKDSQYLAPVAQESYLHSVVSGALDRLHYETDPCVKYDTKRKIWIYLHRSRTEEEFERLHQQQQGMAKSKKSSGPRKPSRTKQQKETAAAVAAATKEISSPTQLKLDVSGVIPSTTPSVPVRSAATVVRTSEASSPSSAPSAQPARPATGGLARVARASGMPRTLSVAGQPVQNLQVSAASGLQTIQVTTSPTILASGVAAGKSLLATATPSSIPVGASLVKTVTLNAQGQANPGTVMKTVTLTPQQVQAVATATARNVVGTNPRDSPATVKAIVTSGAIGQGTATLRMPLSAASLIGNIASPITVSAQAEVAQLGKTVTTTLAGIRTSAPSVTQPQTVQKVATAASRPGPTVSAHSIPSPRTLSNAVVNVSQVQLVGSRSPQSVTGKTLGLSGVKLVNAVKAVSSGDASQQQQTIFIKHQVPKQQLQLSQQQTEQVAATVTASGQPQKQQQKQQQQQQMLQQQAKQAAAIAQLQQQLQQQQLKQLQQQQQQQIQLKQQTLAGVTATTSAQPAQQTQHRLVTTMSVLNQGQGQPRVVTRVGGKPIPVSHVALTTLQQQGTASTTGTTAATSTVTAAKQQQQAGQSTAQQPPPMVAKVLTNAQGQVISMESLLAHQKQHGTLPQGTALRVTTTGGKPGQTSLIQIPSSTPGGVAQFAVVSQGNLLSVGQPRVLQTHLPSAQQGQAGIQQGTKLVNAATGKPIVAGTGTTTATNLRMLSPGGAAGSLNLAHIGGKPVLLASKAQPIQGAAAGAGQNVILTQATGGQQTVVLASQALRAQGGTLVLQQGGTQQILLPPGFQGGTLNIKTLQGLQGLQGLKVIPLSQATAAAGKGRQQVYARIISPGLRPTAATASLVHQNTAATVASNVTLQGTTVSVSASDTLVSSNGSTSSGQMGAGPSGTPEQ